MAIEGQDGTGVVNDGQGAASGTVDVAVSQTATGSTGATGTGTPNPVTKPGEPDAKTRGLIAEVQKERKARQEHERRLAEYETRIAERERQIAALTGSKVPTKDEADEAEIRERMEQIFPWMKNMSPEKVDRMIALADKGDEFEAFTVQQHTKHGRQMLDQVYKGVQEQLGGELTERQKQRVAAAYVTDAGQDPNFMARHDAGDPKLIEEFVKSYLEDFVEPVRRKSLATEVSRQRPVPFGKDRSLPSQGGKTIDVNDPKAVEDFLVKGFKEKGGEFTGRR